MKKIIATLLMSIPIITAEAQENQNPLLKNWTGNYGGVPAFNEYKITDLKPAIKIAIQEKLDEYNTIANNSKPSTFENTIETRKVFAEYPSKSLILITGQCHMPRASALLEAELRNVDVLRMPVPGGCNSVKAIGLEFLKYVYSRFYVLRRFLADIQSFLPSELN